MSGGTDEGVGAKGEQGDDAETVARGEWIGILRPRGTATHGAQRRRERERDWVKRLGVKRG
jgi:hypothetical protein